MWMIICYFTLCEKDYRLNCNQGISKKPPKNLFWGWGTDCTKIECRFCHKCFMSV